MVRKYKVIPLGLSLRKIIRDWNQLLRHEIYVQRNVCLHS